MTSPPETSPPESAPAAPRPPNPQGAPDGGRAAELSAAKRALLQRRLAGSGAGQRQSTIVPRPAGAEPPLSSSQLRMWFLEQLEPGTGAFNIPLTLRLRGPLDHDRLEVAWNTVVTTHEALRTTFADRGGEQVQVVAEHRSVRVPCEDLSHLPAQQREPAMRESAQRDVREPIDVFNGPLWRVKLIRLAADDHVLVLVVHHAISDEHSTNIMLADLAASYRGEQVPAPPVQYGDVALWQQQRLTAGRIDAHVAYWRESLAGAPTLLELPTDRPRPAVQSPAGDFVLRRSSAELSARLDALAKAEGATPFMVLLAGYAVLLARYAGQDDLTVGVPVAGRDAPELDRVVGCLLNTLVLRVRLDGEPSFRELLRRVRRVVLDGFGHAELPFEQLVEKLKPERSLAYSPLFQAMFNLIEGEGEAGPLDLPEVSSEHLGGVTMDTTKADLSLTVTRQSGGLAVLLSYRRDLFTPDTGAEFVERYLALLGSLVEAPDRGWRELPVGTEGEVTPGDAPAGGERTVVELFEAQVEATPEATALVVGGAKLTYAELNDRANRLAQALRERGVARGELVGVAIDRSAEMAVAVLGVLKVGGAYLPLDLTHPSARLAGILAQARPSLLLVSGGDPEPVAELEPSLTRLDLASLPDAGPAPNPPLACGPDDIAYVVHTSGSTGTPKGILARHRGVANYLSFLADQYNLDSADVVLQIAGLGFDASVRDLLGPLCVGAKVVLLEPEQAKEPAAMLELVHRHRVTCLLSVVPTLLRAMVTVGTEPAPALRLLLCSGERLYQRDVTDAVGLFGPQLTVVNQYGPTECTMTSTFHVATGAGAASPAAADQAPQPDEPVPAGRPIPGAAVYVLDRRGRPVPPGMPGEVYIGGVGVSAGYLNDEEQTRERFLPDPFADEPGALMYRTGDRGRLRHRETLIYLGRLDDQVKVRGIRVEPGEVEAALRSAPGVRQAAVAVRADGPGGSTRLVGYITTDSASEHEDSAGTRALTGALSNVVINRDLLRKDTGKPGGANDTNDGSGNTSTVSIIATSEPVREWLKQRLPDHLVPATVVVLGALPLTPNGKVDRKALPAPPASTSTVEYVAPRTPEEEKVAAAFAEVLGAERIGAEDNFFDAGGDSFAAVKVTRLLGDGMRVLDLFRYPTVAELAAARSGEGVDADPDRLLVELTPPRTTTPAMSVVCVPYAGGSPVSFQPLAAALPAGYRVYGLALPGHELGRPDEERQPLEEVAQAAADEIASTVDGPVAVYGHCSGSALAVELARALEATGRRVEHVYLAAGFPNTRLPGRLFSKLSLDRFTGDRRFQTFFRTMGGFGDELTQDEIQLIVANLRHDSRAAEEYFTRTMQAPERHRLAAPITCIVGDRDPLTRYYNERFREWEAYTDRVSLCVLDRAGHYFLRHRAQAVAEVITGETVPSAVARGGAIAAGAAAPAETALDSISTRRSFGVFSAVAVTQFATLVGSGMTGFALGVWVFQQTGSTTLLGLISLFAMLPGLLVSPLVGAVVDRVDRRKVMIGADVALMVSGVSLGVLLWTDSLQPWHLFVLSSWFSICNGFVRVAYTAAVPQLIPKRFLGRANGLAQSGPAVAQVLAPLIAGALVVTIGLHGLVIIDLATFAIAIVTLLVLRFPNRLAWRRLEPALVEIAGGFRYLFAQRNLVALLSHAAICNMLLAMAAVLVTPLVLRSVDSPSALGVVMAAGGIGAGFGGLVMAIWGGPARLMHGLLGFAIAGGGFIAVLGTGTTITVMAAGMFGFWCFLGISNACYTVLIQVKVPHHLHGRIFAMNQVVAFSTMPLGFAIAGPLADNVFEPLMAPDGALAGTVGTVLGTGPGRGVGLLLVIVGVLAALVNTSGYLRPRLRRFEDEMADADPETAIATASDTSLPSGALS